MSKKWPYCMKNKIKRTVCLTCLEPMPLHKTMPGLYKGQCHKDYVLHRRHPKEMAKLIRAKIQLGESIAKRSR